MGPYGHPTYPPHAYPPYQNRAYATAPPPAAYYYQPSPAPRSSAFICFPLCCLFLVFIVIAAFCMDGSHVPDFYVTSLYVPSFVVTNEGLNAVWEANIRVKKGFVRRDTSFNHIEGWIYYNDDVDPLCRANNTNYDIGTKKSGNFDMKISTNGMQHRYGGGDYHDLAQDKGKGEVKFNLRLVLTMTYKSSWFYTWSRDSKLKMNCDSLKVSFPNQEGPGKLADESEHKCYYKTWRTLPYWEY